MSSDTLCVIGLDGADYELLKRWDCNNILLENHRELETIAEGLDIPSTLEVWPTIATGLSPQEHGIILDPRRNDSRLVRLAGRLLSKLPDVLTDPVVDAKKEISGYQQTGEDHIFSKGTVREWPGITTCSRWARQQQRFQQVHSSNLPVETFLDEAISEAGAGLGWLHAQQQTSVPIAGVKIHLLDYAGHIYSSRVDKLRHIYELTDELIGAYANNIDSLLILSDHGMQVSFLNDEKPGVHSWRAMVSSTYSSELPSSVYEVRNWVERKTGKPDSIQESKSQDIDAPTDHLKDLGYI